jgi:TRAP transporter TAXI family solute receptor
MRKVWDFISSFLRWIVLAIVVLFVIYLLIRLLGFQPPQEFTIATGREDGAYYAFAEQYQERFAEEGYTLNIRPTAGSHETIDLLNAGEVDAGFIQNTAYEDRDVSRLSTLASIFYEPLWIFHREGLPQAQERIPNLEGMRIGVGEVGSGTFSTATALLNLYGINAENSTLVVAPSSDAAEQLKAGELDVMFFVSGASSSLVSDMLTTPGIDLLRFTRRKAYTSRLKNIFEVELGEGVIDLAQNIPSEDKQLLAATATLVANDDLHPDLARLLLVIATEIHTPGGILEDAGEFPAPVYVGIPMNKDATIFLERGPTGLERVLPLWMASRLERIIFLLLPVALIMYPLLRGAPSILAYFYRYRVKRRYQYLRDVEEKYKSYDLDQLNKAIVALKGFQQDLHEKTLVPASKLDEYYELRMHTSLTLDRLQAQKAVLEAEVASQPAT